MNGLRNEWIVYLEDPWRPWRSPPADVPSARFQRAATVEANLQHHRRRLPLLWRGQLEVHHPEDAFIETHITKLSVMLRELDFALLSAGNRFGKKQSFPMRESKISLDIVDFVYSCLHFAKFNEDDKLNLIASDSLTFITRPRRFKRARIRYSKSIRFAHEKLTKSLWYPWKWLYYVTSLYVDINYCFKKKLIETG